MTEQLNDFDRWALSYDEDMRKADDSDDWMFGGY
jgi:hypothetical protein